MIHPPKQGESQIGTQGNPLRFRFLAGRFRFHAAFAAVDFTRRPASSKALFQRADLSTAPSTALTTCLTLVFNSA